MPKIITKIPVKIHYPIEERVLGSFDITLTKTIKVNQLMKVLRKHLNLNHMNDINVHVDRDNNLKFYPEKSNCLLFLKENDEIHLVSENCMATSSSMDFDSDTIITNELVTK